MHRSSEDKIKTTKLLLDCTKSKIDLQMNADNALDSKSGTLLALAGTIVVFYIGIFAKACWVLGLIPISLMAVSIYFLIKIIQSKEYNTGVIDVYDESLGYREMDERSLLNQLLSDYQKAFEDNNAILDKKNEHYRQAILFFLLSIVVMIIFSLI